MSIDEVVHSIVLGRPDLKFLHGLAGREDREMVGQQDVEGDKFV